MKPHLLSLFLAVSATSFNLRIQQAQQALLSTGPTYDLLEQYERLAAEIPDTLARSAAAQVYYKKALVEISLNKAAAAAVDLLHVLDLDPLFAPAASNLGELWLARGQFEDIRRRFDAASYPELHLKMEAFDQAFERAQTLACGGEAANDEALQLYQDTLVPICPDLHQVYELRLKLWKFKAQSTPADARDGIYRAIVDDYALLLKLLPLRSLQHYPDYAQYLLFTAGSFENCFMAVKSCLRMDHDYKPCASLSKVLSRMQGVLRPAEDYFIRDEYLYHPSGDAGDSLKEMIDSFSFDWPAVYLELVAPVKVPKREMKDVPRTVSTNFDYLLFQADKFAQAEFGNKDAKSFPLVLALNKMACEASAMTGGSSVFCTSVDESKEKFLPKHVKKIDAYLKKGKLSEARKLLEEFNKNVQKTDIFHKLWEPIRQDEERRQQQQRQQQQQQRQQWQQQQQQQQSHMDRSKDYYKILDVSKDADEKTIKRAYRLQTLKYHPDKVKKVGLSDAEIESKMQEINEAYEILSNPQAKADYDNGPHTPPQHGLGGVRFHQGMPKMNFQFNAEHFMRQFQQAGSHGQFWF